ncbi:MAG: ATP synthase subunit C [Anaerolineaceae bacterium]|nr:ATP synthase subunit C [Anaerolineaceae bacterium]
MSPFKYLFILLIGLIPLIPAVIFFIRRKRHGLNSASKGLFISLSGINVIVGLAAFALGILWLFTPQTVQAAGLVASTAADPYASLAAALSTGISAISAGIAVGNTGSAALGTIAEKPELFGQALIFVGLAEGIAIYGLLISFIILNR